MGVRVQAIVKCLTSWLISDVQGNCCNTVVTRFLPFHLYVKAKTLGKVGADQTLPDKSAQKFHLTPLNC